MSQQKARISASKDVLTKSLLEKIARRGVARAVITTMEVMGYNLLARDGWIIKVFPDNRIEKVSPISEGFVTQ